jgi:hypothetical protein
MWEVVTDDGHRVHEMYCVVETETEHECHEARVKAQLHGRPVNVVALGISSCGPESSYISIQCGAFINNAYCK